MEEDGVIEGRTYQSLKEHFRKQIARNLRIQGYYREFDEKELMKLIQSYDKTAWTVDKYGKGQKTPKSPKFPSSR